MRILNIIADWKWTGPSEPILDLCDALRARGHDVWLSCHSAPPTEGRTLPGEAAARGVPLGPVLGRSRGFLRGLSDACALGRFSREKEIEIIQVHQTWDHLLGAAAVSQGFRPNASFWHSAPLRPKSQTSPIAGGVRTKHGRWTLVRTNWRSEPLGSTLGGRTLLAEASSALLSFSARFHEADRPLIESRGGRASWIPHALRLERFPDNPVSARDRFGFGPEHFVVGMVLRVQKHRRVDIALEALARAAARSHRIRALILGRGTRREELFVEPVRSRGLEDLIRFAGYVGEGYVQTLAAFDALLYLVPGSDGTARALREVLALGRPAVVSDLGMLPEIVEDARTGFVVRLDPEAVADRLVRMAESPELARAMGQSARQAMSRFDMPRQAEAVEKAYEAARNSQGGGGPRLDFPPDFQARPLE